MKIPKLSHHKPKNRAYVRFSNSDGLRVTKYLGRWGDPETEAAYDKFVRQFVQDQDALPLPKSRGTTVRQLAVLYLEFAEGYYARDEVSGVRGMIKRMNSEAGEVSVANFTPKMFKRVRDAMIAAGNSRRYINQQHGRIVAMLSFGVEHELVPPNVPMAIRQVKRLRRGKSAAKERPPVKPVPDDHLLAAIDQMPDELAVMVQLQLLMGCRPGELWVMTPASIDRLGDTWNYRPEAHKNTWREKERVITVGPHAQELLAPYLLGPEDELCFHTLAGKQWDRYRYRYAIHQSCKLAGVPCWNPYQLRHNAGTEVRSRFGLDGTQVILGHSHAQTSEIYAELDAKKAVEIARRIG